VCVCVEWTLADPFEPLFVVTVLGVLWDLKTKIFPLRELND